MAQAITLFASGGVVVTYSKVVGLYHVFIIGHKPKSFDKWYEGGGGWSHIRNKTGLEVNITDDY